jgi:PrtD family type I secretion system ABC transporter
MGIVSASPRKPKNLLKPNEEVASRRDTRSDPSQDFVPAMPQKRPSAQETTQPEEWEWEWTAPPQAAPDRPARARPHQERPAPAQSAPQRYLPPDPRQRIAPAQKHRPMPGSRSVSGASRRRPPEPDQIRNVFDAALDSVRRAVTAAGIFSFFTNILMLAGPLYMMQVYDRVLTSRSVPTLIALTVLLVLLYAALGVLEMLRSQIMNRIAGRFESELGPATLEAIPRHKLSTGNTVADEPLRDLGTLRHFISGSGPSTFFDLPWVPLFMILIFMMHWVLGVVTLIGMVIMLGIALFNEIATRQLVRESKKASEQATKIAMESGRNMEVSVAMGMMDPLILRWQTAQERAGYAMRRAGDRMAAFSSASKIFRMFMQSALLGVSALLAIEQLISAGTMIAVSVIGGRALAPISTAVSQWASLINAREAFTRLKGFHERYPVEPKRLSLPTPKGRIEVRNLQATPPGASHPSLRNVNFLLEAGEAVGVIGQSAAGKSTLARVMVGLWQPDYGSVRLDSADLRMWNREQLGPYVGYLPQTIELFDGTIAQNISRFYPDANPDAIFRAAERMGVHEMIVELPDGYNFRVGEGGMRLSAGQRQRIGLARAVYGDPVLVVLDEPNANLDVLGEAALQRGLKSLKEARTTVVMITHRPGVLEVMDRILILEKGEVRAFGERSQVLQLLTRKVAPPKGAGEVKSIPQTAEKKEA